MELFKRNGHFVLLAAILAGGAAGFAGDYLVGHFLGILLASIVATTVPMAVLSRKMRQIMQQAEAVASVVASGNCASIDAAKIPAAARNSEAGPVLDRLLDTARNLFGVMRQVGASVNDIAIGGAEVSFFLESLKKSIARQLEQAIRVSTSAEELSATTSQVAQSAACAAKVASSSRDASEVGRGSMERMLKKIRGINGTASTAGGSLRDLYEQSKHIHSITEVINTVADQTNLLALNAAIEAARAGEHGRGFAVVADEVRELANRSAGATREIDAMLKKMESTTETSVRMIGRLENEIEELASGTIGVEQTLVQISTEAENAASQAQQIVAALNEQVKATSEISEAIHSIREELGVVEADAGKAAGDTFSLSERSEVVEAVLSQFELGTRHKVMIAAAQQAAKATGEAFEAAVVSGEMSLDDLFDRNYEPMPRTNPQKFHTRYDRFTDRVLPAIQEPILDGNPDVVFAGAVDSNGYFPTHNRRYSQPLTGDHQQDLAHNRTKRIFNDRTGSRCGAHTEPALLQTYKRDTGEVMHDVSAPIFVQGRHWGGFRIGYRAHLDADNTSHFDAAKAEHAA
jgi:methyl-accepting chemotaxis protein